MNGSCLERTGLVGIGSLILTGSAGAVHKQERSFCHLKQLYAKAEVITDGAEHLFVKQNMPPLEIREDGF